ncbi:MAG: TIGR01906 family membrane protein [Dehalococcoidia bacterium]
MGLVRSVIIGLIFLAIPVALITTNIRLAASEQGVYDYSVREYGAAAVSGIPESELLRANGELLAYFEADSPGPLRIEVRDEAGQTGSLFNARETAHLADVRDLFRAVFTVQSVAVAAVLTLAVVMLALWPARALAAAALYGSLLTVGIIGVTGMVALTGFDAAWSQFHFLAFSNDFWRLNPFTDHLIQMYPESFWRDITLLIGGATVLESLLIAGAAGGYLRLRRPGVAVEGEAAPSPTTGQPGPASRPRAASAPDFRLAR